MCSLNYLLTYLLTYLYTLSYTFTLEPNTNWIGWTVSEIWPFKIMQDGWRPRYWIWSNRKYSLRSADPKTLLQNQTRSESHDPLQKYGQSTFSNMATGRHRVFDPTGSSTIRSADVENRTHPRTKHEVDRMTRCRDMAVRNFPKCEVGRSVVGRRSVGRSSICTLMSCTPLRYVRNVAREEWKIW